MSPPQDHFSHLGQDIHGCVWQLLDAPSKRALYAACPAVRSRAVHSQIKKMSISCSTRGVRPRGQHMFAELNHFPSAAILEVRRQIPICIWLA
jgi:hypothetical protein